MKQINFYLLAAVFAGFGVIAGLTGGWWLIASFFLAVLAVSTVGAGLQERDACSNPDCMCKLPEELHRR